MGQRIGGAIQHRAGEFDFHGDIGHVMLERLERADGLAKLFAIHAVIDGDVEHALGQTKQLSGGCQHTAIHGGLPNGFAGCGIGDTGLRSRCPFHAEQTARLFQTGIRRELHRSGQNGMHFVVVVQQQQIGDMSIGHQRIEWATHRNTRVTRGDFWQPFCGERMASG